jgi:hypothetical protein
VRPYLEEILHKNRDGGVTQGEDPEFKTQYHKKKKKTNTFGISKQNSIKIY